MHRNIMGNFRDECALTQILAAASNALRYSWPAIFARVNEAKGLRSEHQALSDCHPSQAKAT